jgi:hypothetical protein
MAACIFALLQHYNIDNSQRFTVTLWSLWKHRNLKLWQDVDETVAQVADRVHHLIEDWSSANSVTQDAAPPRALPHRLPRVQYDTTSSSSSTTVWQRPHRGRLKCNIDASFFESLNRNGIGMCIRDAEGIFVLAKTLNFPPKCMVPLGEAMRFFFAL